MQGMRKKRKKSKAGSKNVFEKSNNALIAKFDQKATKGKNARDAKNEENAKTTKK